MARPDSLSAADKRYSLAILGDSEKMKIAFLILAHDQPSHLAKLVNALTADCSRIFIHIDKKADIREFKKFVPEHTHPIYLGHCDRIDVHWGGFSVVEATLNLLNESLNFGEHFDRFCLLSGSDFPIRSLSDIEKHFNSKKEFMRIDRRLNNSDNNSHCKNVRNYHFMDSPFINKFQYANRLFQKIPRKSYDKISLFHGCQWFSLTNKCVKHVMQFIKNNQDYVAFHKRTLCPDEIFFNSIVKNSAFAADITHDFERINNLDEYFRSNVHGCHYIDWNARKVKLPKILDESDFDILRMSEALFARKFREPESFGLLNKIIESIANS